MFVLDAQQKAIYDIITESKIRTKEQVEAEVARLERNPDEIPHSVLSLYASKKIKDRENYEFNIKDPLLHLTAANGVEITDVVDKRLGNMDLLLSYLYIYKNMHNYYVDVDTESPISFFARETPLLDDQFFKGVSERLQVLIKERYKADTECTVSRSEIKVKFKALGKTHEKTFKCHIDKRFFNETYMECIFIHMSHQLYEAIGQGTVHIDDERIKQFVIEMVRIYSKVYS